MNVNRTRPWGYSPRVTRDEEYASNVIPFVRVTFGSVVPPGWAAETEWRRPSPDEVALVERMLSRDFAGVQELRSQLAAGVLVRQVDPEGSFKIRVPDDAPVSPVAHRVPVEAQTHDVDGMEILFLLHVIEGRLDELEIFRGDGELLRSERIDPNALDVY